MTRARRRGQRRAPDRGRSHVGEQHEVEVGPVAHGGHCVARVPVPGDGGDDAGGDGGPGRVVFVRHALPGERVLLEVTQGAERDRFWRGDAVRVLEPSPDRVDPPCPHAGPGACGGCDLQHVALARQRSLKAEVVRDQLRRVGHLDPDEVCPGLVVEPLPGDGSGDGSDDRAGLRWRTRVRFAEDDLGRVGPRVHRSHEVVPLDGVEDCRIAAPGARVVVTEGSTDVETVVEPVDAETGLDGDAVVREHVTGPGGAEHAFSVAADGFWQAHPGAPGALVGCVLEMLAPRPGERALDLYAGVGLFARFLTHAVGADAVGAPGGEGEVIAVEGDAVAAGHAADNLAGLRARVLAGRVDAVLAAEVDEGGVGPVDLVVLDPPREGARREVVEQVAARGPRAVAYVACDPAALARDLRTFVDLGYRVTRMRAFDAFPMTHHVECVALLTKIGSDLR